MKFSTVFLLSFFSICISSVFAQSPDTQSNKDKFHQFDFWLGEWDVYKYGTDTLVGHSKIESVIDSMGILENYSTGRYEGTSLNKYNLITHQWEQFWIDNSGLTLKLAGGLVEEQMILENRDVKEEKVIRNKITWTPLEGNKVRQVWEISQNDGATWKKVFDGLYVKK